MEYGRCMGCQCRGELCSRGESAALVYYAVRKTHVIARRAKPDVAIRISLQRLLSEMLPKGNGLPHQSADWFAMTW